MASNCTLRQTQKRNRTKQCIGHTFPKKASKYFCVYEDLSKGEFLRLRSRIGVKKTIFFSGMSYQKRHNSFAPKETISKANVRSGTHRTPSEKKKKNSPPYGKGTITAKLRPTIRGYLVCFLYRGWSTTGRVQRP